ncbi:MAG: hypothetical protein SF028_15105 [Candidatus Sumerlaeia bacterium]|nr:hypothetical protein [Candidatus Sumerlaeia bacterium]
MNGPAGALPDDPFLRRLRVFLGLFSVFFFINVGASEYLSYELFRETERAWRSGGALAPGESERLNQAVAGPGGALLLLNAPAFVAVGMGLRGDPPGLGVGYYLAMVLGATYAPLLLALLVFATIHPPGRWRAEPSRGRGRGE